MESTSFERYAGRKRAPAGCIGCKACTRHCPQGFEIPTYMEELAKMLEEV